MLCETQPINGIILADPETEIRVRLMKARACTPLPESSETSPTVMRIQSEIVQARGKNIYFELLNNQHQRPTSISVLHYIRAGMAFYCEEVDIGGIQNTVELDEGLAGVKDGVVKHEHNAHPHVGFPHLKINHIFNRLMTTGDGKQNEIRAWLGLENGMPGGYYTNDVDIPDEIAEFAELLDQETQPLDLFLSAYWSTRTRETAKERLGLTTKGLTNHLQLARNEHGVNTIEKVYLSQARDSKVTFQPESDEPEVVMVSARQMQILDLLLKSGASTAEISRKTKLTHDQIRSSLALTASKLGISGEARDVRYRVFQWYMQNDAKFVPHTDYAALESPRDGAEVDSEGNIVLEPILPTEHINPTMLQIFQTIADNPGVEFHTLQVDGVESSKISGYLSRWKKKTGADSNEEALLTLWRMGMISIPTHERQTEVQAHREKDQRYERLLNAFISTGYSKNKLSEILGLTPQVVERYTSGLLKAWGVGRRRELLIEAIKRGKLRMPEVI